MKIGMLFAGAVAALMIYCPARAAEITEEKAVSLALERAFELKAAKEALNEASGRVYEGFSGFLPKVTLVANYTKLSDPQIKISGPAAALLAENFSPAMTATDLYTGQLAVSQPLFAWGRIYHSDRHARLGYKMALAEIKSPLDGIITRYFSSPGETVSPASPVAEVSSTERIKVVVQVSEKDIIKITSGQSAKFYLDSYPSRTFGGRVENISRALDSVTRTSAVEISAENPDGIIRPGMFAKVEILVRNRPRTLVAPRSAVMFNPGGDNEVFTVDNGVARRKIVRTGIAGVNIIEILYGLSDGDKVITLGQYGLSDGDKVNVCAEGVCPDK
ncbi:MAG: efflux RND transporter periplasmic adaptor subunit [Endomicrobiia bacterium]|nr:efflux RND transporter periplasmic adaptor subunit [Endomicrobiia bacterium]